MAFLASDFYRSPMKKKDAWNNDEPLGPKGGKNMITRKTLTILFAVTVVIGICDQRVHAQTWHTESSETDEANSMLYKSQSSFGGKHYESLIYGRDLVGVAKWKKEDNCPISVLDARLSAQKAFEKQFPQFSQFKVISVNFIYLTLVNDWIVNVEFNGTDFSATAASSIEEKKINLLVLLNGRVISPTAK